MKSWMKTIFSWKHAHLCFSLLVLYGISWGVTYTTSYEKILDSLRKYCWADYSARDSILYDEILEAKFYRGQYEKRLQSLTANLFDHRDKFQKREFFLSNGLLYEEWQEGAWRSYLLAEIVNKGKHETEIPDKVNFDYMVLGKKKIIPFLEYKYREYASPFVSTGGKEVYIHRDNLDRILERYFKSLWGSRGKENKDFHWDELTYSLHRDLREVCEDVFIKRLYRGKEHARKYFIEEGFRVYFPTMLAMGTKMVVDQDVKLKPSERYQRALLNGLVHSPNHTVLYLITDDPSLWKLERELRCRLEFGFYPNHPDQITLDQISRAARDILKKMEVF